MTDAAENWDAFPAVEGPAPSTPASGATGSTPSGGWDAFPVYNPDSHPLYAGGGEPGLPPGPQYVGGAIAGALQGAIGATGETVAAVPRLAQQALRGARETSNAQLAHQAGVLGTLDQIDRGERVPAMQDPLGYQDASPEQRQIIRQQISAQLANPPGPSGAENALGTATQKAQSTAESMMASLPIDPRVANSVPVQTARMVGGMAPLVVGTMVGGLPGAAAAAFGQGYTQTFNAATEKGAKPEEANTAALLGGLVSGGLLEIPGAQLLKSVAPAARGPITAALTHISRDAAVNAGSMVGVTAAQQMADNLIASMTYDPTRKLGDGIDPKTFAPAALTGALIPGAGRAVRAALDARGAASTATGTPEAAIAGAPQTPEAPAPAPPTTPQTPTPAPQRPVAAPQAVTPTMPQDMALDLLDQYGGVTPPPGAVHSARAPVERAPVTPTTPEPQSDIEAQVKAVANPNNPKDAMFVAAGTQMPARLPHGVYAVPSVSGTLLTTNPNKARLFSDASNNGALTDDLIGGLLGLPESKSQVAASGRPLAVQGTDQEGNIVTEAAASPAGVPKAINAISPQVPGGRVNVTTPEEVQSRRAELTAADAGVGSANKIQYLSPDDLKTDASRFQYKTTQDENGVTGALRGVQRWEPMLANPLTAYRDADGSLYVVNGHQRLDLAKRAQEAGQEGIQLPVRVINGEDHSPEYARVLGAYQNIAEGSGTPLDAARILRGKGALPEDMRLPELPPRSQLVQDARGLAALGDQAFGMVENGIVPENYASHVGALIRDPAEQVAALDMLAKHPPDNARQAEMMVRDIRNSGFERQQENGLFGPEEFSKSLIPERAKVLDAAMKVLRGNRSVFRAAIEGEDTLAGAGNKLNAEGNKSGKVSNEKLLAYIAANASSKGDLSDALTAAARKLASGGNAKSAASIFLATARTLERRGEAAGIPASDIVGGARPEGEGQAPRRGIRTLEQIQREDGVGPKQAARIQEQEIEAMGRPISEEDRAARLMETEPPGLSAARQAPGQDDLFAPKKEFVRRVKPATEQMAFPGMERSAVQAQAARDQAGRGALLAKGEQKRADEGLFAYRDTTERLPLENRPIGNDADRFSEISAPGVQHEKAAVEYVFRAGHETGTEHLAMYDAATRRVISASTSGERGFVKFPEEMAARMSDPSERIVAVHNHPGGSSLSVDDLSTLSFPGLHSVLAVGHDGSIYSASRGPNWPRGNAFEQAARLTDLANKASYATQDLLSDLVSLGKITLEQYKKSFYDVVSRALHRLGVIDYVSGFHDAEIEDHLSKVSDSIAERVAKELSHAILDRRASAVSGARGFQETFAKAREAAAGRFDSQERAEERSADAQAVDRVSPEAGLAERQESLDLTPVKDRDDLFDRIARIPRVGEHLAAAAHKVSDVADAVKMMVAPMAAGRGEGVRMARAQAKDYANLIATIRHTTSETVRHLTESFSREELKNAWERMDTESVHRQTGSEAGELGVAGLAPEMRAVVDKMSRSAERSWRTAQSLGMVNSEGLPSYVTRMQLDVGTEKARTVRDLRTLAIATGRLQEAIAARMLLNNIERAGLGAGRNSVHIGIPDGARPLNPFGVGFSKSTAQMIHRKHLTVEETEEAAKKVKTPDGETWFTIPENAAFSKRIVVGTDADGAPIYKTVPIYIRGDYEGPLRAILSGKEGMIYRGAMALKGKMMTGIMYGVGHLGVIASRALPVNPNLIGMGMRGHAARMNADLMAWATMHGLRPIGRDFGRQDISSFEENPDFRLGHSWTAQIAGAIARPFGEGASNAAKGAIDTAGKFMHQTLLWDRVADLQMGIFQHYSQKLQKQGLGASESARIAADMSNMITGSIPREAMSEGARKAANLLLFSRSYRFGGLGVIKRAVAGLPLDVRAQIERDAGAQAMLNANSAARRAAIGVVVSDLGFYFIGSSLVQTGINLARGQSLSQQWKDELDRIGEETRAISAHPIEKLNPLSIMDTLLGFTPMGAHEPGKKDRILIGFKKDGTALYARMPFGKSVEDMVGYFSGLMSQLKSMESPFVRPAVALLTNEMSPGHPMYDPYASAGTAATQAVTHLAMAIAQGVTPSGALGALYNIVTGHGSLLDAGRIVGGGLGLSVSQGYPGGPAEGEMHAARAQHQYVMQEAMPGIKNQIRNGNIQAAREAMTRLGIEPGYQRFEIQQALHPHSTARQIKRASGYLTPDERGRIAADRQGATP